MYPNLYYIFKDLLGIEIGFLKIANTFGFLVALSFLAAYWAMSSELKRYENSGVLKSKLSKIWTNQPLPISEFIISAIMGFILGFKIVPVVLDSSLLGDNPQIYILSSSGNWIYGIIGAIAMLGIRYWENKKITKNEPEEIEVNVKPYQNMGTITMVAALFGFLGAKIFHWLEYWDAFIADPIGNLISPSGLTFLGGLIFGAFGVLYFARKKGIPYKTMLDCGAGAMMLSYAVGRMGCHLSGDGDWGIVNSNPKPSILSWLPDWFWAYDYPNNVNRDCNPFQHYVPCNFDEIGKLMAKVYPTPLYEFIVCLLFFALIWILRKRFKIAGTLFAFYLILAGIERFAIEQIRVNSNYNFFGFEFTQAELISSLMVITGIIWWIYLIKSNKKNNIEPEQSEEINELI